MSDSLRTDIAVIGGGSGGLSVAAAASQMGLDVVLVERAKMGGDCLNHGCVPSKALIAAAEIANAHRSGAPFGVASNEPAVDFQQVHDHVHGVIAAIAPHDSVERFEGLGVRVIEAHARFLDARTIEAGGTRIEARKFVIATGSSAAVPPIPGLDSTPFLTNETLFDLTERPRHLAVIGGGPIGIEMAQAHRRLGSAVTVIEGLTMMNKDDPQAVAILRDSLQREGIEILEGAKVTGVAGRDGEVRVTAEFDDGASREIEASHLLVAVGRKPNIADLNLEVAGIEFGKGGIEVDARLRTSNRRVFAIGDVAGGFQFTHVAGYQAGIVIRNALFKLPSRARQNNIPWVTYTDPELAHVGMSESAAREQHGDSLRVLQWSFADNDRAQAERATEGLVKVTCDRRGRVQGATIVGRNAGELILPWVIALEQKLKIGALANVIAPYPTLSEVSKRVAGSYYTETLYGPRVRWLVNILKRFG